jgi:hypothetical protein
MSSTRSIYLIGRPEDSFAGASQNTSTTLSALTSLCEAFAEMIPAGTTTVAFQEHVPGAQFAHILKLESEKADDARMLPIYQKFFCHALISKLPEEALPEVGERLVEIFEDHVLRQAASQFAVSASQPRVFTAQQGKHYARPEINLED